MRKNISAIAWGSAMIRVIFPFILWTWSVVAYGQCSGVSCENIKIQEMQVNAYDDIVWVQTNGTETALGNCVPESNVFLKLNTATGGGKNVFASLLSAQARDKAISIRLQDNVNPCTVAYVVPK